MPYAFAVSLVAAGGCQETDLPPVQVQGQFIAYAAAEEYEVCGGTVTYAEAWTTGVALRLGIDPNDLLQMTYYFVGPEVIADQCSGSACARRDDGKISIFSENPLLRHELVHGIHLSAWPRRQPILYEGLASTFGDEDTAALFHSYSTAEIDAAIESASAVEGDNVYGVGAYLVYWMLRRHGVDLFQDFWFASSQPSTAAQFRAAFEDVFGESLDEMIADVAEEPHCAIAMCVGEPLPWQDGTWSTRSPDGCGDGVYGIRGDKFYDLRRDDIVEIIDVVDYEISVSGSNPAQGALLIPCDSEPCGGWSVRAGETQAIALTPGRYRVTTVQKAPDDDGVTVEIRSLN
jgi:hypothetical protein